MLRQVVTERDRSTLIEEDSHERGESIAAAASLSRTASTCDRLTPGNRARKSLLNRGAVLQVFEEGRDRHASSPEDPRATVRALFDSFARLFPMSTPH